MSETLEEIIHIAVEYGQFFFEIVGIIVLVVSGVRGVILYLRHEKRTHLELAHGMALSLGFLLGAEIIGSVLASDWKTCFNIGALVLLRAAIVVLLHWESQNEEKELKEDEAEQKEEKQTHHNQ